MGRAVEERCCGCERAIHTTIQTTPHDVPTTLVVVVAVVDYYNSNLLFNAWKITTTLPLRCLRSLDLLQRLPNVPEVLQHSSENAKTDPYIAKIGSRHIINQINLPGLELPICVPIHFKPTAYLYGNTLMYNDEEDMVLSYGTRAHRDVFRSLLPDTETQDEVLILVAEMMTREMTIESGY
ncbi:hypothetical protein PIB30_030362 [Stylosanthes scabra]|uniref:Uncharacterized protein n=1 Tax=Stylosanthes scabra TaxID=79078 RepID=A0ABU6VAG0_9FABA|nr:hypothetical protein [Stylosanthes scabra]